MGADLYLVSGRTVSRERLKCHRTNFNLAFNDHAGGLLLSDVKKSQDA